MARAIKITSTIVSLAFFGVAWYFLAPSQIGGQADYVTIRGVSMEPVMHKGDLVILRKKDHYEVNDIAAYRSEDVRQVVLHRIVARDGNRFIMKGDNTNGPDRQRPLESELIGAKWVQLDGMGTWLNRAREPKYSALLAGLAVLLAGGTAGAAHSRRHRRPRSTTPPLPRRSRPAPASPALTAALATCGLLGAVAILLGLVSISRSPQKDVDVPNLWQEKGQFAYEAKVKPSVAYPSGQVQTSQPVFLKLVKSLAVSFDYEATSSEDLAIEGDAKLMARIKGDGGQWTRSFTLAEQGFQGNEVHLSGTLDLAYVHSLMAKLRELTGVPIDSFELTLEPVLDLKGKIADRDLTSTFAPTYLLRLDDNQLIPQTMGASGPLTDNVPLRTQANAGGRSEPAYLDLKVAKPSVSQARILALGLLGLAIVIAVLIGLRMKLRSELDEPGEIERRFGDLLVPVTSVKTGWTEPIEVDSIESLVHLAERYDRAILHLVDGDVVHHYLVEEEGSVYRYVAFANVVVGSEAYVQAARAQAAQAAAARQRQQEQDQDAARAPEIDADWPPQVS